MFKLFYIIVSFFFAINATPVMDPRGRVFSGYALQNYNLF